MTESDNATITDCCGAAAEAPATASTADAAPEEDASATDKEQVKARATLTQSLGRCC